MKPDIEDKKDIQKLVDTFYEKVKQDEKISHFFRDVISVDWSHHLPKMYDFWFGIAFHASTYSGNPVQTHQAIHALHPLQKADFERWYFLFCSTVDELFSGDKSELIKQRALSISTIMQIKTARNELNQLNIKNKI